LSTGRALQRRLSGIAWDAKVKGRRAGPDARISPCE
jgi:hypothetical protein